MAKVFELRDVKRDVKVAEVIASNLKEANTHWDFYLTNKECNCKVVEIGRYVNFRTINYTDLSLIDRKELNSITDNMLTCVIKKDFSNVNTTFFMLERGLVNAQRDQLSDKGNEIFDAWLK